MRYLLDTNILSALLRDPDGRVKKRIRDVGEEKVCTSIVVAAELRYGATKKGSKTLADQLEAVLDVMDVHPLEAPVDTVYGTVRVQLEKEGRPIGGNDLLIAAQALSLGCTLVTDNEREFSRVEGLAVENWLRDRSLR